MGRMWRWEGLAFGLLGESFLRLTSFSHGAFDQEMAAANNALAEELAHAEAAQQELSGEIASREEIEDGASQQWQARRLRASWELYLLGAIILANATVWCLRRSLGKRQLHMLFFAFACFGGMYLLLLLVLEVVCVLLRP